jgi:hypothetical protein
MNHELSSMMLLNRVIDDGLTFDYARVNVKLLKNTWEPWKTIEL